MGAPLGASNMHISPLPRAGAAIAGVMPNVTSPIITTVVAMKKEISFLRSRVILFRITLLPIRWSVFLALFPGAGME
jgi:hypothetical protein